MKVTIANRWTGAEIFSLEGEEVNVKAALLAAIRAGAYLRGADLRGAYLRGAYLQGAYLRGADLQGADLQGAYLRGADLQGADLRGAYLRGADLRGADLRGAYLQGAYLQGAKTDGEEITIEPIMVSGLRWWVLITEGYMRIGCQQHSHAEWAAFDDERIVAMDSHAAEFWKVWKAPLMTMCEQHAAKAKSAAEKAAA